MSLYKIQRDQPDYNFLLEKSMTMELDIERSTACEVYIKHEGIGNNGKQWAQEEISISGEV